MTWESLADFIRAEDPALAASLRGVPGDRVRLIEREYRLQLPEMYRQFLFAMGDYSDRLNLFGPQRIQRFEDLVAQLPSRLYPVQRYFKIAAAIDANSEISPADYFLDLSRSDGVDAPIVAFQDTDDAELDVFDPARVRDTPFTFSEQATNSFFTVLVLQRATAAATVAVGPFDDVRSRATVVDVLGLMGFTPPLPPQGRVIPLRRGTLGALINDWESDLAGVTIALGADDTVELEVVLDQLLARFPDAFVQYERGSGGL
jgi:hypothetical protein